MVFNKALVSEWSNKSVAVSTRVTVGRGRRVLLALLWAGLTAMGAPGAFAQLAGGFPGGSPGRHPGSAASGPWTCRPERPVSKVGEPVKIHVEFVNRNKVPVSFRVLFYPVPESVFGEGTPPLKISVYNPVTHFFPQYIGPAVRLTPPPMTRLRPGAFVGASFDLTKFYRLPPGTYNVTIFYLDQTGPSRAGTVYLSSTPVKSANFRVIP